MKDTLFLKESKIEKPRSQNNYDTNDLSDATGLECKDPSLTQQQFAEESDINFIADRYGLTGELPQVANPPMYGDFTGIFDFQSAQNAVIAAQAKFMELPAKLRARFDNSPQKLLEFLADDDNRKEAEFLGLVNPPPVKAEDIHEARTQEISRGTAQERARPSRAPEGEAAPREPQEPGPKAPEGDRRGDRR